MGRHAMYVYLYIYEHMIMAYYLKVTQRRSKKLIG